MRHRTHAHLSRAMLALLAAVASVGIVVFIRELPAMRRYIRMERM